eukprot:2088356-Prorocentrum_lima.AAC.1
MGGVQRRGNTSTIFSSRSRTSSKGKQAGKVCTRPHTCGDECGQAQAIVAILTHDGVVACELPG